MKGYNMKKRVIAFVLAIAVIFGSTGLGNWMGIVLAEGYITQRSANGIVYFATEDTLYATKTAKKPAKIYYNG